MPKWLEAMRSNEAEANVTISPVRLFGDGCKCSIEYGFLNVRGVSTV
jgi:hypothetical protein